MVGREIRRVSRGYHYFFVKPRQNESIECAVERLMKIEDVKEVSVTEGEYGFIVKAAESDIKKGKVLERISKAVGGRPAKAVCYCSYVRNH